MPKGTRVSRCIEKLKRSGSGVNPYAVCQASTKQSYATGKSLKEGSLIAELSSALYKRAAKAAKDKVYDADIMSDIHAIDSTIKKQQNNLEIGADHHRLARKWRNQGDERAQQSQRFTAASKGVKSRRPPRGYPLGAQEKNLDTQTRLLYRKGREDSSVNNFEKMLTTKLLQINEVGDSVAGREKMSKAYLNRQEKIRNIIDKSKDPAAQATMGARGAKSVADSMKQMHKVDAYMNARQFIAGAGESLGIPKHLTDLVAGEKARQAYRDKKEELGQFKALSGKRRNPVGKEVDSTIKRGSAAQNFKNN